MCDHILKKHPQPDLKKKLLFSEDDDNIFLGEDIEELEADIENGDAVMVTAEMPYKNLKALLEELGARKAEEGVMFTLNAWTGGRCFEDWPGLHDSDSD